MVQHVYVNTSTDFSSVFREHIVKHENPHGISKKKKNAYRCEHCFFSPQWYMTATHQESWEDNFKVKLGRSIYAW